MKNDAEEEETKAEATVIKRIQREIKLKNKLTENNNNEERGPRGITITNRRVQE